MPEHNDEYYQRHFADRAVQERPAPVRCPVCFNLVSEHEEGHPPPVCSQCFTYVMSPVERMLSTVCGTCVRENHKKATR